MGKMGEKRAIMMTDDRFIRDLCAFLDVYRSLLDAYVLDFFVHDLWSNCVPKNWRFHLDAYSDCVQKLGAFISDEKQPNAIGISPAPLSLLAFQACCSAYSTCRTPITGLADVSKLFFGHSVDFGLWPGSFSEELVNSSGQNRWLPAEFRMHVKPKKQHELWRIGELVHLLAQNLAIDHVLDIGSGIGHLSRYLSLKWSLNVASIEMDPSFVDKARKLDSRISRKHMGPQPPKYVNSAISYGENGLLNTFGKNSLVIGLHSCGDLSAAILKEFVGNSRLKGLVSLGCCYMKLNGGCDKDDCGNSTRPIGYPLSEAVKQHWPRSRLPYTARELSCHALEQYAGKLGSGFVEPLKIHCYRAILESLIIQMHPMRMHEGLRSVKNGHALDFQTYARRALSNFSKLSVDLEHTGDFVQNCLKLWHRVVIFYSLRLMLAPVVETLILLDRRQFLRQFSGIFAELVPVFDPVASPRNIALVAIRRDEMDRQWN